jgi:rhodanese-related sulfurtransferase/DNA-binding transcriptional ArsR family regulator
LKRLVYEQIARITRAAAHPARLELLELLAQTSRAVEALAGQTGHSVASTSHHLQILRRARLVESEKHGLYVTYRIADPLVGEFLLGLRRMAESRLTEIHHVTRQYLEERRALEPIDNEELVRRVREGGVTVIDVRPREEYVAGHLPGAISMPVGEVAVRARELPRKQTIVAYCRGPYCVMAIDAVELLRRLGFRAHRMEHGVPEWRARGWRVETGEPRSRSARR